MSLEFLVTALVVALIPGTGVVYTLSCGLAGGWRASLAASVGCTLGIIPHLAASILGLAAVLHASAVAFQTVKFAGVAYLLWLAWSMWRDSGALAISAEQSSQSGRQIIGRAILVNILNPKLSIFFLALLPQFVPADEAHPLGLMLLLSGVFMAATFFVFVGYGLAAASVRSKVVGNPRVMTWLRRSFAGVVALLGLRLAMAEHQR